MRAGMWTQRIIASRLATRLHLVDFVLALILIPPLLLLLLPLLPLGNHDTMMHLSFRADGTQIARNVSVPISAGVCSEIQYAITDGDPHKGAFTKVGC